jgi:hypothetical protein
MTIAGDVDKIEVGFDTGTADSDKAAEAARRIVTSSANPTRDVDDLFKPYPEQSDDRTPREDVEKWLRTAPNLLALWAAPPNPLTGAVFARPDPFVSLHPIVKCGCDGAHQR